MSQRDAEALAWLMTLDPAIRWQAMRDLAGAPEREWSSERSRIETEGWGAALLAVQDADGQWAGGAFVPAGFDQRDWREEGQPWTATSFVLTQLRELGLDPNSRAARRTVDLVGRNSRWDEGGRPFWEGETEECINGRLVADGAYFGVDVAPVVDRLLDARQPDGGWNCERCNGSTKSSFASTVNVLEGLLEYERATGGTPACRAARRFGEDYLLARHLFRRLATGAPADERFLALLHPSRWHYDLVRALDYFRSSSLWSGTAPDSRLREAVEHLRGRRSDDGRWPLDRRLPGRTWVEVDGEAGAPSPWITLKAMRILGWWDSAAARPMPAPPN